MDLLGESCRCWPLQVLANIFQRRSIPLPGGGGAGERCPEWRLERLYDRRHERRASGARSSARQAPAFERRPSGRVGRGVGLPELALRPEHSHQFLMRVLPWVGRFRPLVRQAALPGGALCCLLGGGVGFLGRLWCPLMCARLLACVHVCVHAARDIEKYAAVDVDEHALVRALSGVTVDIRVEASSCPYTCCVVADAPPA